MVAWTQDELTPYVQAQIEMYSYPLLYMTLLETKSIARVIQAVNQLEPTGYIANNDLTLFSTITAHILNHFSNNKLWTPKTSRKEFNKLKQVIEISHYFGANYRFDWGE